MPDISSTGGIQPGSPYERVEGQKTSPQLFNQIQEYLQTSSKAKLLLETVAYLEMLSQEELEKRGVTASGFEEAFVPDSDVAATVLTKINNAKELIPLVQQLHASITSQDERKMASAVEALVGHLAEPDNVQLTTAATTALSRGLQPLLESAGESALVTYLTQVSLDPADFRQRLEAIGENPILGRVASGIDPLGSEIQRSLLSEVKETFGDPTIQKSVKDLVTLLKNSVSPPAILAATNEERGKLYVAAATLPGLEKMVRGTTQYIAEAGAILRQANPADDELKTVIEAASDVETHPKLPQVTALSKAVPALYASFEESKAKGLLSAENSQRFLDVSLMHMHKLAQTAKAEAAKTQEKLGTVREKAQSVPETRSDLSELQKALENVLDGAKWNPQQMSNIAEVIIDLAKRNTFTDEDRKKLESFFSQFAKVSSGVPLPIVLAQSQMRTWVDDFTSQNKPPIKTALINQWLTKKINDVSQTKMQNSLWERFVASLKEIVAENFGEGTDKASTHIEVNSGKLDFDTGKAEDALSELQNLQEGLGEREDTFKVEEEGLAGARTLFATTNQKLQLGAANVQSKRLAAGAPEKPTLKAADTLPPEALKKLMTTAGSAMSPQTLQELMSLQNLIANLQNGLQNYTLADILAKYIVSTAGGQTTYNISPGKLLSILQKELGTSQADLASMQAALGKLNTLITQLQQQQATSPSTDVQKLLQQLQTQKSNLTSQISNMQGLIGNLTSLSTIVSGQQGNSVTVLPSTSFASLQNLEKLIKMGDSKANPPLEGIEVIYNFFNVTAWGGVAEALQLLEQETSGFSFSNFNIAQFFSQLPNGDYNISPGQALQLIKDQMSSILKDKSIATTALQQVNALLTELKGMQPQTTDIKNLINGLTKQQNNLTNLLTQMNSYISQEPAVIAQIQADISAGKTTTTLPGFQNLNIAAFNIFNGNPAANYGGIKDIQGYFFKLTWQSINIATEFVQAIDTYMGNQDAIVSQLNAQLSYLNSVGSQLNAIEATCQHFQFAPNNYDLPSFFPVISSAGGNTTYNISPTLASQKVDAEISNATTDQAQITTALGQIQKLLTQLQGMPQTTQVKQLETKLQGEQTTLNTKYAQITTLLSGLNGIKYYCDQEKGTGAGDTWLPSHQMPNLANYEQSIVGGADSLQSVDSDFQTLKGSYATLSQRQQMLLQMTMTEVQQEWTMVTSALQTLMEMYKTIVQTLSVR